MGYDELVGLADSYPDAAKTALLELAQQEELRKEREILEVAAIPANLTVGAFVASRLFPEIDPLLAKAFAMQYPDVDPSVLVGMKPEHLTGFINGVKGKYFEVLVEQRLNAGETLGELKLGAGQVARLAMSPFQPGWDLEILSRNGRSVEQLQLKATQSMSYVKEALERYPDIRVAVPAELDSTPSNILGTSISHAHLDREAQGYIGEVSKGLVGSIMASATGLALNAIPLTSLVIISTTEGYKVLAGRATLREAVNRGGVRLMRATIYHAIGKALAAAGLGPGAIPVTTALGVAETRVTGQMDLSDGLQSRTEQLSALLWEEEG